MCPLNRLKVLGLTALLSVIGLAQAFAANDIVNLTVGYKTVDFTGKAVQALAINDQIPGPTLHFKEGDTVTINVYNHLKEGTTIHWHGLIVPWNMDGVEGVSQEPIPPGGVYHYQFTLKQSGTYWYHAHTGLQEQEGMYGAIIIDPLTPSAYHYDADYPIVLSDWSDRPADQIYANLKKSGDYYSSRFPLQPSLVQFIKSYDAATPEGKKSLLEAYNMMQQSRMSVYDISDVAYDAFLLNGKPNSSPWTAEVKVGDVVRLRFIGAMGSTIYHVKIPGTTMQLVNVDGHDIVPLTINTFDLTPGETYDVLVKIAQDQPYIIYAESADTVGGAYGALMTSPNQKVDYVAVKPFPTPQPMMMSMPGMAGMGDSHSDMAGMDNMPGMSAHDMANMSDHSMAGMDMGSGNSQSANNAMPMQMDNMAGMGSMPASDPTETSGTKYQDIVSPIVTNDPNVPIQEIINMELSGYMDRYIWFINGVPEYKAKPILIEPGKRYRIIFTNDSMMDHPMHLHGHWMILRNGHRAYDPLMHTIDVPPGATVVVDFDADASGQWYFHCHNAFHMASGMARVFQYTNFVPSAAPYRMQSMPVMSTMPTTTTSPPTTYTATDAPLVNDPAGHKQHLFESSYFELGLDPLNSTQEGTFKSLIGYDYNKFEINSEDFEMTKGTVEDANVDLFYWHLISQFWAIKGGANYTYRPAQTPYWQPGIGIEGLLPYFIDTDARIYMYNGSYQLNLQLSRDTQITDKFFIRTGIQAIMATKTVTQANIGSGLNQMQYIIRPYYQLNPIVSLYTEFNYTYDYGALANIDSSEGQPNHSALLLFGASVLF